MINFQYIRVIFSFFLKTGIRAKRAKLFFILSFIPALIIGIIKAVEISSRQGNVTAANLFTQVALSFFFHLFIQILALFYGSSVINEELDNKTLIYLTTSRVSKLDILLGKYLAQLVITSMVVGSGLVVAYIIAYFNRLTDVTVLQELVGFLTTGFMALLAYSALFTMAGVLLKKPIISGIVYIFGWETVVQFLPGTTQKLALNHYINSLLPASQIQTSSFLKTFLRPSSTTESVLVLLILSVLFLGLAALVFSMKEYLLSESD